MHISKLNNPAIIGVFTAALVLLFTAGVVLGQSSGQPPVLSAGTPQQPAQPQQENQASVPTPLAKLIEEAERNNFQILAARHAWKAATLVPSQVSTLPDPQFTVQQFAVGSPRPFAGFSNSDFAYIGLGVAQDLPYPGKLRLRGEIAQRDASTERDRYEAARRSVVEQLKAAYFRLAYELQELQIVERDRKLLEQVAKIAEARYRVGQGNQQDVLKAQLEQTKLLRETEMHHQEHYSLQAQLKQLLNQSANQADVIPETLTETPLNYTVDELLEKVRAENPEVRGQEEMVRRQGLQLELARKDFYPDFSAQYMWQHTAEQFRDYYVLSVSARIPIYRRRRLNPEMTEAVEELERSRREYESQAQSAFFEVRNQYIAAETSSQMLKIYREGLIPQALATYQSGLTAYQTGRLDFESLLLGFMDVLNFDEEYWKALGDHETALGKIEELTGVV